MQAEESGHYADMEEEMRKEKRGKVTLDAADLRSEPASATTPLAAVVDMLGDPDPWMRAQAARRLAMVHPAPVETIPTLIRMLDDKEAESRRAAAAALGSFGPLAKDAAPRLRQALADPDDVVVQIAREALKQIQTPQ
jgi:HEAT repeat protein